VLLVVSISNGFGKIDTCTHISSVAWAVVSVINFKPKEVGVKLLKSLMLYVKVLPFTNGCMALGPGEI
jgi:hypothetical protein